MNRPTIPAALKSSEGKASIVEHALLGGSFVLVFLFALRRMSDSDLWAHLKCGEYLFREGKILTSYYFNCSWPDFPYVNHSWLFQAVIYAVHSVAGEWGLVALQVLLVVAAFMLLAWILRSVSGNDLLISAVLIIGTIASQHRFALRPQHFTYIFLLSFLIILDRSRRGHTRALWLLPVIMLLWVNMHAESLWGFVILGVFLTRVLVGQQQGAGETLPDPRLLLKVAGAVLLAALLNPFTWKTIVWPVYVMKEQFAGVEEILPPTRIRFLFFWIYFGLVALSVLVNLKRADRFWLALSLIFGTVAWTADRGIPHFVFVSAPLLVGNTEAVLARFREKFSMPRSFAFALNIALLGTIAALCLSIVTSPRYLNKFDNIPYPENALSFLKRQGITGNVINEHIWGGFIIWNSWPGLKPYIDGRFFHKKFYEEFYPLLSGQAGWDGLLDKYNIDVAVLAYSQDQVLRLNDRLYLHPDWRLVYWDDLSLVYLRSSGKNSRTIEEFGNNVLNPDRDLYTDFTGKAAAVTRKVHVLAEKDLEAAGSSYKASIVAANTLFALGDYQKALVRYERALTLLPSPNAGILYQMAMSYRKIGDLERTEEYLVKCLAIAPDAVEVSALLREVRMIRQWKNRL